MGRVGATSGLGREPLDPDSRILWVCEEYEVEDHEDQEKFFTAHLVAKYPLGESERWDQYDPSMEHPDLFLEFARLRERDPSADTALGWAHTYGLLGSSGGTFAVRKEPLWAFFREVGRAAMVLALYQAALDEDDKAIDRIISEAREESLWLDYNDLYLYQLAGIERGLPDDAVGLALSVAGFEVQQMVKRHVHPAFFVEVGTSETPNLKAGWGYENLLGAMYLQMYWLMGTGGDVIRCRYCGRIISLARPHPDARKVRRDKSFCDDACRQRYHYHNRTKPRRQGGSR